MLEFSNTLRMELIAYQLLREIESECCIRGVKYE